MTGHATRILVPTDFSAPSDAALEYARELCHRLGASLLLLHVVEEPVGAGRLGPEIWASDAPGLRDALLRDAQSRFSHRITPEDRQLLGATSEVIFGRAADTVAEYAAARGVDLIVMGTHGRTGMAHLFLGSVAEKVMRTAPCPVLTVRDYAGTRASVDYAFVSPNFSTR